VRRDGIQVVMTRGPRERLNGQTMATRTVSTIPTGTQHNPIMWETIRIVSSWNTTRRDTSGETLPVQMPIHLSVKLRFLIKISK